ncbi:helix-turn-helix transcriptional regulator [Cohnella yongneupensis]|uniref:Helix-turn-helix transcriptional regulator n=1 Tax=Cohnella yongneupensis TaxID=425006 RepID=A0ABW0QUF3_9BACL
MSSFQEEEYRELADRVGGDDGRLIHKLIDIAQYKLIGSQDVAAMIGILPNNMDKKRKTKYFPEPVVYAGKFPFWVESDIREYIENIEKWREKP